MGLAIGLGALLFLALGIIYLYNGLVTRRIRTQEAWSQIDVQLKRRYDLIPNLVETVKGYAKHERETLEKVVQARSQAMSAKGVAEQADAENMLSGALRQLFALSESYPALKANENFARLQEELASTENRIAFARQNYNDSCAVYNAACLKFPATLIANTFGFKPAVFFQVEEPAEREAPKVQF
jgi:LemA protein